MFVSVLPFVFPFMHQPLGCLLVYLSCFRITIDLCLTLVIKLNLCYICVVILTLKGQILLS